MGPTTEKVTGATMGSLPAGNARMTKADGQWLHASVPRDRGVNPPHERLDEVVYSAPVIREIAALLVEVGIDPGDATAADITAAMDVIERSA